MRRLRTPGDIDYLRCLLPGGVDAAAAAALLAEAGLLQQDHPRIGELP